VTQELVLLVDALLVPSLLAIQDPEEVLQFRERERLPDDLPRVVLLQDKAVRLGRGRPGFDSGIVDGI